MNETVEAIFTQMFAPQPVPDEVKQLYERAKKLADRIDQMNMRPLDFAIMAAVAISFRKSVMETTTTKTSGIVDTSEEDETETGSVEDENDQPQTRTGTGPMDAPALRKKPERAVLETLTNNELRTYCEEEFKWKPPFMKKSKIIDKIMAGKVKPNIKD